MENTPLGFFAMAITALAIENALFFRVLGFNKYVLFLKSPKEGLWYGGTFTVLLLLSAPLVSLGYFLLWGVSYANYLWAPLHFVCVALVFLLVFFGTRRFLPGIFEKIRDILPITAFNTALFGVFYVSAQGSYPFAQTMGYALGTGAGYTMAVLIVYYARKRLAMNPTPRSFRGLPILLIYIGLFSLALYGLIGQGSPT